MIDFLKKILNSNKFRQACIQFLNTGSYCSYPSGTSEYYQFWDEEMNRCINGYTADDGDYITGYNYFYINYCPIQRIVHTVKKLPDGTTKVIKTRSLLFPDFYDYDYYFFLAMAEAEEKGKHMCVLKSRRKGYSYKNAAMACRNYYLIPNSKTYIYASNKQYLTEDGILTKAWDYMDFIDKNTAWGKKRSVNTSMRKRAGFFTKDEFGNEIEMGYKSEIIGVSLKDNPDATRGKAGKLIIFEEAGSFPELGAAWLIARPSVEQDGIAFGTMVAFGCVCAGTKVWTANGKCVSIEELNPKDGIMGWDTYLAYPQNISNVNPPAKKPCLRITTNTGRTLECSTDHPLLWSTPGKTKRVPGKRKGNERMKSWLWHKAELCKVGDQVGVIDEVPYFGDKKMWEPRLVGWLIGDGSYGNNKTPILSNCDEYINNYILENFDTKVEKSYLTKDNKLYCETRIKGICKNLRELGIYGQTRSNKTLPINIDDYDFESLSELIGGLYDTDGYIRVDKDGRVRVILTQAYDTLLKQLQILLIKFGISSSIRYIKYKNERVHISNGKTIRSKNGLYRLEINDITSVCKFADRIPLTVQYKLSALDMILLFSLKHINKYNKYLCGIHAERIVSIEDIGLQTIYNLTAKEQNNYIANGIVTHNTGGDPGSSFEALRDMFYNPDGYNCLSFENIWDSAVSNTKCGFFIPQYTNLDIRNEDGKRIYMDDDGNTNVKLSLQYILDERKIVIQNATSSVAVDRYVAERCITPLEACLEFNGNIFPKKELQELLGLIRTNKALLNHKQVGDLIFDQSGLLKWIPKKLGDITKYPLGKDDDPKGAIVIWEHPVKDAPSGLYIIGVDPYDHDLSGTNSLGSSIVYKRFLNFESYYDIIVAEYTGRPTTAEEYYENLRKLAIYYNARIMYENERKGLFPYFTAKHCDYLLADLPDIINDIVGNSKVQRKKGCHMNKQIKQWGEGMIKDWLNEEYAPGKKNLTRILSEPLLEELISYNDTGNFDRCLSKGTMITTIEGDKAVEDITVTDRVLTHTGHFKLVTWTDSHVHLGNMVTLKCSGDYQTLVCTDNHPILIKYTNKKKHCFRNINKLLQSFLRADQLNYKYLFALLPKRLIDCSPRTVSNRMLYVLGWIMGDGWCSPKGNEVKITYQLNQLMCAEQCKLIIEEFDKSVPCRIVKDKNSKCYRLYVYSRKLHDLAINFGCIANNKKINYNIYNNHKDLVPFVLGLLEADGHLKYNANYDGYNRNAIEISTIYEELIRLCRQILIDNGIYSTIRRVKPRNGKTLYNLLLNNEYVKKLLDYYTWENHDIVYDPIFSYKFKRIEVKRNTSKVLEDSQGFWVPIKLLDTKITNEIVYNFEVQNDHTYVSNGITTHNCMALMQVMIYKEQLYNVVVKQKEKENKTKLLFDGPIFAQSWFQDDKPNISNDDNVYTF